MTMSFYVLCKQSLSITKEEPALFCRQRILYKRSKLEILSEGVTAPLQKTQTAETKRTTGQKGQNGKKSKTGTKQNHKYGTIITKWTKVTAEEKTNDIAT